MLRNYFLIHLRSILKKPILAGINLFGLAIGLSVCLLAYLHIQNELSFDKHNLNGDRIYRLVNGDVTNGDGWVKVSAPIPPLLEEQIPEIEAFTRLARVTHNPKITVRYGQDVYNEANFYMADASYLTMFNLPLKQGNSENAIADINSVIISDKISSKLFNNENPIGKTIELGGQHLLQVSGVFVALPAQSHVSIDYLINFQNLERILPGTSLTSNWGQFNYFAYVMLNDAEAELEKVVESKIVTTVINLDENNEMRLEDLNLQPLPEIHFAANRGNAKSSYDPKYLFVYATVAIAILLISIINFINLTVAGSTKRIKEVGVRKVVGAGRGQLIIQYISESFVTTFLALGIALVFTYYLLLPAANDVLKSNIFLDLSQPGLVVVLVIMTVLISLMAGFYIAVFVTGFQPSRALRGSIKIGRKGGVLKNLLLGAQFTISLILILSSIFIYKQLGYLQVKDLGLNPQQIVNISLYNKAAKDNAGLLKRQLEQIPWVQATTATRFTAGSANWHQTAWWEGQQEEESMSVILADEGFIKTLNLTIIEGDKEVLESIPEASEVRYILNEAARDHIGWDTAVGKSYYNFGEKSMSPIAGVVKNFNYQSLHKDIDPVVIAIYNSIKPGQLMVKIATDDYQTALAEIEDVFTSTVPNTPFEYHFLDDQFQELYQADNRTKQVVGFITVIAMVLALLGLYGLVSFAVQERTKEMAIRKVLGVTMPSVLSLLSSGYLKLLLLANILAIPVVWYAIDNWLNNFNYRIELSPAMFLSGSALVWLFVVITVSFNVYQVSKIDPVNGLRYE
jgi:putative ABC transport system permease protein